MLFALQHAGLQQAFDVARRDGPVGDAPRRRLDLDHRLQPEQPARAGPHDAQGTAVGRSRARDRRRDAVGPERYRLRVGGDEDPGHAQASDRTASNVAGSRPDTGVVVDEGRRPAGAEPEAEHGFQRDAAVRGRLVPVDAEPPLHMVRERDRADRLAGFGPAQFHHMPPGRRARKSW